MSDNKLVLLPTDPEGPVLAAAELTSLTTEIGLAGDPFDYFGETRLKPGPRFAQLVLFSTSHKVVTLQPTGSKLHPAATSDSRWLCSLQVNEATDEIQFLGAANAEEPVCPTCSFQVLDWSDAVGAWYDDKAGYFWPCPQCGRRFRPWQLDWRNLSGFGRFSIDVWGIAEGEAVPAPGLLRTLQARTNQPWTFFFFRL